MWKEGERWGRGGHKKEGGGGWITREWVSRWGGGGRERGKTVEGRKTEEWCRKREKQGRRREWDKERVRKNEERKARRRKRGRNRETEVGAGGGGEIVWRAWQEGGGRAESETNREEAQGWGTEREGEVRSKCSHQTFCSLTNCTSCGIHLV